MKRWDWMNTELAQLTFKQEVSYANLSSLCFAGAAPLLREVTVRSPAAVPQRASDHGAQLWGSAAPAADQTGAAVTHRE